MYSVYLYTTSARNMYVYLYILQGKDYVCVPLCTTGAKLSMYSVYLYVLLGIPLHATMIYRVCMYCIRYGVCIPLHATGA